MTRLRSRPGNPTVVLAIILTVQLMVVLDASIVITALPQIHTDLGFSPTGHKEVQGDGKTPEGWYRASDKPWSTFDHARGR